MDFYCHQPTHLDYQAYIGGGTAPKPVLTVQNDTDTNQRVQVFFVDRTHEFIGGVNSPVLAPNQTWGLPSELVHPRTLYFWVQTPAGQGLTARDNNIVPISEILKRGRFLPD